MSGLPAFALVDSTLRDGEQAPGVALSDACRVALARSIVDAGVSELEAGIPAMGPEHEASFALLTRELPQARLIAWNRMRKADLEASFRAGARLVHASLPVSDLMLRKKLGWERERALGVTREVLAYCRDSGVQFIVGAEDASRADPAFLEDFFGAAAEAGAIRLRYADTVGRHDPFSAFAAVRSLTRKIGVAIEYHAHNDLGLATANSLAAVRGGARALSVTVGGLGERAGNAALEQIAAALPIFCGLDSGVDLAKLPALCAAVAEAAGRPIPCDRPLVGSSVFSHESGLHVDGLLKDPELYEFVKPASLGRTRALIPGPQSGTSALRYFAGLFGRALPLSRVADLREKMRALWSLGAPADPWSALSELLESGGYPHVG